MEILYEKTEKHEFSFRHKLGIMNHEYELLDVAKEDINEYSQIT